MRKFILFAICATFLCACSVGIEKDATEQMEKTIRYLAKDPDLQISDTKAVFKTDSMIVLQCLIRGKNGLGGYKRSEIEYVYGIFGDGATMECLQDLEDKESVLKVAERVFKEVNAESFSDGSKLDSIQNIKVSIVALLSFFGNEVKK